MWLIPAACRRNRCVFPFLMTQNSASPALSRGRELSRSPDSFLLPPRYVLKFLHVKFEMPEVKLVRSIGFSEGCLDAKVLVLGKLGARARELRPPVLSDKINAERSVLNPAPVQASRR